MWAEFVAKTPLVPALIDALKDPHAGVRGWAAHGLYRIGVGAKAAVPAAIGSAGST